MLAILTATLLWFSALSAALIQRHTLNEEDRSTAFWTNAAAGTLLMLVGIGISPPDGAPFCYCDRCLAASQNFDYPTYVQERMQSEEVFGFGGRLALQLERDGDRGATAGRDARGESDQSVDGQPQLDDRGAHAGAFGTYQQFSADGETLGGMLTKPPALPFPFWLYYFNVDDVETAAQRVEAGGGQILYGPTAVPGGAWIVHCTDPQGAIFALLDRRQRKAIGYFISSA